MGGASLASLDRRLATSRRLAASTERVAEPACSAARFRNFGTAGGSDKPDEKDIYAGFGTAWDTQVMFTKLMQRMAKTYTFKDGATSANDQNFNPYIPAGYTYLAQFAAHDIVRNSALQAGLTSKETDHTNLRERSLLLDALYGGGPTFSELLYELPLAGEGFRSMLRTSPIARPPGEPTPGKCPYAFRDIPRFQQSDMSDGDRVPTGRPDVLVPDQRNDDNANIAQVTALFHHLHNAVVTALRALPDMPVYLEGAPKGLDLFENARLVTSFVYRSVIRDDLLGHLLIGPVWERYVANGFKPLADVSSDGIPLEFSHSAYRLGHAMVRMSYRFNDADPEHQPVGIREVLANRSSVSPWNFPVAVKWIVDWSKLFEMGDAKHQPSRRIGPSFNEILLEEAIFPNPTVKASAGGPNADAEPDPFCAGLLLRDLTRGTVGGLLTLDGILKTIPNDIRLSSPLLANPAQRVQVLRDWLEASDVDFSEPELVELSTNPPLMLWLLFEAADEANGCHLGTLGSIIVGDVFVARLAASHNQIESDPRTPPLLQLLFPGKSPSTMPELIRFIAKVLGLDNVEPLFVSNMPTT